MKFIAFFLLSFSVVANASDLICHEDPRSNKRTCFDPKRVTEENGIRYADYWSGGPKEINPTTFTFAINCKAGVMHLKDRKGVSFSSGSTTATTTSTDISKWICEAKLAKRK